MEKKIYHISGFDCPNCAAKTERHIAKQEYIEEVKLDYTANKLYISYKEKALTMEELIFLIREVESDPLEIYEESDNKVVKRVYFITGFDCANCAAKVERHLNKQENVANAKLDYTGNKLYISSKDKGYSVEELRKVIEEVEDDPLEISEEIQGKKEKKVQKIFTKHLLFILIRIIIASIITGVCVFALGKAEYNWLRFGLYIAAFIIVGYDVTAKVFLHIKNRTNPIDHNLLITLAAIGAFVLGIIQFVNWEEHAEHVIINMGNGYTIAMDHAMDAMMVIILFQVGRIIEAVATNKSKAAVMKAVELRVDTANLITENGIVTVAPEELTVGQKILVKVGELIPVDGEVIDGSAFVDMSSLTGEFVPVKVENGKEVFSGSIIKEGNITVEVKKIYADSTVSKILELISSGGERKSKADEFIAKFGRFYTPIVMLVSALAILIIGLVSGDWMTAVYEGLEVLVTGCPCAIVISVPLAYFAAIGLASKNGIVVKGAAFLDKLVNLRVLVTDKTGTLTKGSFSIQKVVPNNVSEEELLDNLYAVESLSNHPIGKAVLLSQKHSKNAAKIEDFCEIAGFGVQGVYQDNVILAGNKKLMEKYRVDYQESNDVGTIIYVAKNNKYLGYVVLSDEVKENAKEMIEKLHKENIKVVLLTGDHEENAKDLCNQLSIDTYKSELLPDQKADILEEIINEKKQVVAFAGDGINDAPSIIRSDVGIAMGAIGSDIAVENSDIVIMNDDPIKIYSAVKIAKIARRVALFNIIFSLAIKIAVAVLVLIQGFIPGFSIPMYVAVLADTGLTVVMVINSLLVLYRKVK